MPGASRTRRRGLPSGSNALAAAIIRLERERFWPGAIALALRRWAQYARSDSSPPCGCPACDPFYLEDERQILETALHVLPVRIARELRSLLRPLDDIFLARTSPDPFAAPDLPWWRRRSHH
ncbi:hypothetical protein [Spirillospora sp. NPDC029432]|uniref:hypothetical protein n=1 Tax=Spirillospora sp. NPDC029432 TaxID=3154599 RepID=UPI003453BC62